MAMLPLLLAVAVWTNPAQIADTALCGPNGQGPLYDLKQAALIGQRPYSLLPETLGFKDVAGREGLVDSLTWADGGLRWITWMAWRRSLGPWSCESNRVAVNIPDTGVSPAFPEPLVLYDVAGRRFIGTPKPGIYFRRLYGKVYRAVVVR